MTASLIAATLAGLVGSPHCAGMCGGFAVACGSTARRSAAWHVGRLMTYAGLGALAGAFGALIPGTGGVAAIVSALLVVVFAAVLGGWLPEPRIGGRRLVRIAEGARRTEGTSGAWLFGLANGLLPCGLVWAALALPLASGSALTGALTMVAFGLGTVPVLAAVTAGARALTLHDLRARRLVALGVLVSGLLSIGLRAGLVPGADSTHTSDAATAAATGTSTSDEPWSR
ncbi:MAG: sulfite exporter TauE/SafE family protein [Longimicrobiales bacterium]|nr:sulfite exporter TauE/SafE family protein [Longimicrobiales bacterium]